MIREAIEMLIGGKHLSQPEAAQVMEDIMTGEATPAQLGAFLVALRLKGETEAEIAGMAGVMREKALRVSFSGPLVDTCGTGGDGAGTFNISTAAAFVAAGAGLTVAKHGNRAASSRCGSADVLEALGVKIELTPEQVAECLDKVGMGFMFAPAFHPAMRYAAGPRREIGIRTIFNILGPLTNPAGAQAQALGVAERTLVPKMAEALVLLGCRHGLVFHGAEGIDEISICGPTTVYEIKEMSIQQYVVHPEDFGLPRCEPGSIKGGTAQENAVMMREVLRGGKGALRDVVALNAAAALVVGGKAANLKEGVPLAQEVLESGAALAKLDAFIQRTQSFT